MPEYWNEILHNKKADALTDARNYKIYRIWRAEIVMITKYLERH